MKTRTQGMTNERYSELRNILEERRDEISGEVKHKIRNVRTEAIQAGTHQLADSSEASELDIQDDIEFVLLQMKAETLTKISAALTRLEERTYGYCYECGDEIAEQRLRALPFAVRCRECEEVRETVLNRERVIESRTKAESLFGTTLS